MIWNTGEGNGFTTGESWLAFAKAANRFSVENQELEPDSMLHFYRRLLALRKEDEVLRNGFCWFLDTTNTHILAYCREIQDDQRLIVLNMSAKRIKCSIPVLQEKETQCEVIFATDLVRPEQIEDPHAITIGGYQGRIYRLVANR